MSARFDESRRERIAFEEKFNQQQRDSEDKAEFERYAAQMRSEGATPLDFEAWRGFIPDELKNESPAVRGAAASANSTWNRTVTTTAEMVANQPLADDVLSELGFNLKDRIVNLEMELTTEMCRAVFEKFIPAEPRFDLGAHYSILTDFILRNKLFPSLAHVHQAFNLLMNLCLLPPKPEPEPERTEVPNRVNLQIESDPEFEARKRREEYLTTVVATDPRSGEGLTAFQIERLPSEEYRRLVFGEHGVPRVTDVIQER